MMAEVPEQADSLPSVTVRAAALTPSDLSFDGGKRMLSHNHGGDTQSLAPYIVEVQDGGVGLSAIHTR
jgi:hypothetical protein